MDDTSKFLITFGNDEILINHQSCNSTITIGPRRSITFAIINHLKNFCSTVIAQEVKEQDNG